MCVDFLMYQKFPKSLTWYSHWKFAVLLKTQHCLNNCDLPFTTIQTVILIPLNWPNTPPPRLSFIFFFWYFEARSLPAPLHCCVWALCNWNRALLHKLPPQPHRQTLSGVDHKNALVWCSAFLGHLLLLTHFESLSHLSAGAQQKSQPSKPSWFVGECLKQAFSLWMVSNHCWIYSSCTCWYVFIHFI